MDPKQRQMQDEMARFEQEIQATNTPAPMSNYRKPPSSTSSMSFLPHQLQMRHPRPTLAVPTVPRPTLSQIAGQTTVISAAPKLYSAAPKLDSPTLRPQVPLVASMLPSPDITTPTTTLPVKAMPVAAVKPAATTVMTSSSTSLPSSTSTTPLSGKAKSKANKKGGDNNKPKKPKKLLRSAGGHIWEDTSLSEWDPNDFRVFCGDLGHEVTDELLTRTFNKYPTFVKAKVIRERRSSKSKGYGFVSFKNADDFAKAIKEINGKYVGNRPIKLRKSSWKERNLDVVRKKNRERQKIGLKV